VHSARAAEHDRQPGERTDPGPEDGHRQEGGLTVRHAALHGQQARLHLSAKGRPALSLFRILLLPHFFYET
jgi:hypothetical protein